MTVYRLNIIVTHITALLEHLKYLYHFQKRFIWLFIWVVVNGI